MAIDHRVWMQSAIGAELTESEAREIHYISRRESYDEGARLFVEGDPALEFFLIAEGEVDVVKRGANEAPTVLSTLKPGAIVGEMSLLMQDTRNSSAVATSKLLVFRIEWAQFQKLLQNEPKVAFKVVNNLARLLATRLKRINGKMTELMTQGETAKDLEDFAEFKHDIMSSNF